MKNWIHTLILIVCSFLFSSCAPTVSQDEYLEAQTQIQDLEYQLQQTTENLADTEQTLIDTETKFDELSNELIRTSDANQLEINNIQAELDVLQEKYKDMSEKYVSEKALVSKLEKELEPLFCNETIENITYDNILDTSTILSAWVANQDWSERVLGTYRDTIWSNADTKIHAVRYVSSDDQQTYVDHFLVYFDEFNFDKGVFWVHGQCWLTKE